MIHIMKRRHRTKYINDPLNLKTTCFLNFSEISGSFSVQFWALHMQKATN